MQTTGRSGRYTRGSLGPGARFARADRRAAGLRCALRARQLGPRPRGAHFARSCSGGGRGARTSREAARASVAGRARFARSCSGLGQGLDLRAACARVAPRATSCGRSDARRNRASHAACAPRATVESPRPRRPRSTRGPPRTGTAYGQWWVRFASTSTAVRFAPMGSGHSFSMARCHQRRDRVTPGKPFSFSSPGFFSLPRSTLSSTGAVGLVSGRVCVAIAMRAAGHKSTRAPHALPTTRSRSRMLHASKNALDRICSGARAHAGM